MNEDNDFLLFDRVEKIKDVFNQYGIENFCISYSGGKDSSVLSTLIDIAVPDNKIPRVFMHTGIELNSVVDFVHKKSEEDTKLGFPVGKNEKIQSLEANDTVGSAENGKYYYKAVCLHCGHVFYVDADSVER